MNTFQRENLIDAPWAKVVEKYHSPYKFDFIDNNYLNMLYTCLTAKFFTRIEGEEGKINRFADGTVNSFDEQLIQYSYIKFFKRYALENIHTTHSENGTEIINIRDKVADNYPMKYLMSCYF